MVDAPAVALARLAPDETVRWSQGPGKGEWTGPLWVAFGMGIGLFFMGGAPDIPGPFAWVGYVVPFDVDVLPAWALPLAGVASAASFIWLGVRGAIQENLSTWVVTDRRILRLVPLLPWLDVEHPLAGAEVRRAKAKPPGGELKLRVFDKDGKETLHIRARSDFDALLAAVAPRSTPVKDREAPRALP